MPSAHMPEAQSVFDPLLPYWLLPVVPLLCGLLSAHKSRRALRFFCNLAIVMGPFRMSGVHVARKGPPTFGMFSISMEASSFFSDLISKLPTTGAHAEHIHKHTLYRISHTFWSCSPSPDVRLDDSNELATNHFAFVCFCLIMCIYACAGTL